MGRRPTPPTVVTTAQGGRLMPSAARAFTVFVAACLSACDTAVDPDPRADDNLAGWIAAYSQVGVATSLPEVTVHVRNALGATFELPVAGNGSWVGSALGPEPYVVTAQAEGFAGVSVEGVSGGTSGVVALLVERSTVQVLQVDEAVLEGADVCGNPHCLFLRFTVAEEGAFPYDAGRLVFRLFIGDSGTVTPEHYRESQFLVVGSDDPLLQRGETEMTITMEALRGFDFDSMNLEQLSIYLVGATENQLGLWGPEIEERGWPDLAETGAGAAVTR